MATGQDGTPRRLIRTVLGAAASIAFAWTVLLVLTGGFDGHLIGMSITAHDGRRPIAIAALFASMAFLIGGDEWIVRRARAGRYALMTGSSRVTPFVLRWHLDVVAVLLLSALVTGMSGVFGSKAAGGSDSYGYVSQADLWLSGRITLSQPWIKEVPWPNAAAVATPLGFRSGPDRWLITPPIPHAERDPQSISPFYPPGLPLLMAGAKLVAGHAAMFWIPPIAGGVLVLATFGLGRRLGSPAAGLISAWLVATSPNVMQMEQSMMSDVPVAAAWAVTYWALLGASVWSGALAGVSVAVAILIRPNLVFMSLAVLLVVICQVVTVDAAHRRRQLTRGALVIVGIVAGSAAVSIVNWILYGSPFVGGLGRLQDVLHWSNVPANFMNYTRWFVKAHTAFGLAGIVVLFVPIRQLWPGVPRWVLWCLGLFVVGIWLNYLLYGFFETEFYLRFLLSSWPFIMLGVARLLLVPAEISSQRFKRAWTTTALLAAFWWGWMYIPSHPAIFAPRVGDSKYATAAHYARQLTPENSAFFAMQHSGSARYYAGRVTLRYDFFSPDWLDRSIRWLTEHGVHPYLFAEDWERDIFAARFKGSAAAAALSRPPLLTVREVLLYDLAPDADVVTPTMVIPESAAILDCLPPVPAPTLVFRTK